MMTVRCNELVDVDLVSYFDDPTDARWSDLREHADSCEQCRAELDALQELRASSGSDATVHPADDALLRYVDDPASLDRQLFAEITQHLSVCASCRDEVHVIGTVSLLPVAADSPAEPASRRRSIRERLIAAFETPMRRPLRAAAAFAVVLALALPVLRQRPWLPSTRYQDTAMYTPTAQEGARPRPFANNDADARREAPETAAQPGSAPDTASLHLAERAPDDAAELAARGLETTAEPAGHAARGPLPSEPRSDRASQPAAAAPAGRTGTPPPPAPALSLAAKSRASAFELSDRPGTQPVVPHAQRDETAKREHLSAPIDAMAKSSLRALSSRDIGAIAPHQGEHVYRPGARDALAMGTGESVTVRIELVVGPVADESDTELPTRSPAVTFGATSIRVPSDLQQLIVRVTSADGTVNRVTLALKRRKPESEHRVALVVKIPTAWLSAGDNPIELLAEERATPIAEAYVVTVETR